MHTSDSCTPRRSISRMSKMVASCDCLFKFVGGIFNIPRDIACGLANRRSTFALQWRRGRRTHLMTWTDHPRFAESEFNTPSNSVLFSGVKVLESTEYARCIAGSEHRYCVSTHPQNQVGPILISKRLGNMPHRTQEDQEQALFQLHQRRGCMGQGQSASVHDTCMIPLVVCLDLALMEGAQQNQLKIETWSSFVSFTSSVLTNNAVVVIVILN